MPDHDDEFEDDFDERPSKTQIKRELDDLKDLGVRLLDVPVDQLHRLPDAKLIEAVEILRQIRRGSARKRQVQYIGKLLRDDDIAAEVRALLDRLDASSKAHVQAFHQLERWRDRLIDGDPEVMDEIFSAHPDADRQQLRQLVRKAIDEKKQIAADPSKAPVQFRKLFQHLRELTETR